MMTAWEWFKGFYHGINDFSDKYLQDMLLLFLRLYWGYSFFMAGYGKLTHISDTAASFSSIGIPMPYLSALLTGCFESICGLLLFLGIFSRMAAVPLIVIMIIALLTAHHEATFNIFVDQSQFVKQSPVTYLIVSLVVLAFGPGKISLDYIIDRFRGLRK